MRYSQELAGRFISSLPGRLLRVPLCGAVIMSLALSSYAADLLIPDESFESDGQTGVGDRYLSNQHLDGSGTDFFQRHDFGTTNPHPSHNQAIGGALDGDFAFAGEDVDTTDNPLGSGFPAILRLNNLTVTGNNILEVTIGLACSSDSTGPASWETDDFIRVQAAFDGNSGGTALPVSNLNNGTYTTVG